MAENINSEISTSIYEVGYHLIPTLAEEAIPAEADAVKALITENGGEIISEGLPQMKDLAYEVSKYTKAYFGWVKFSVAPESIEKIKTSLDASKNILRHLIVGTVKESTLMADKEKRPARPEAGAGKEKEIDKAIDELVTN